MTEPQIKAALPAECRSEALGADENGVTIWIVYDAPTLRMEIRDTETDDVVYAETISPEDAR
jgi:hypothetical protein